MLSKKLLSASQTAADPAALQDGSGFAATQVSSTLLPSTVVCYTSGIVNGSGGLPVDGYYRDAATGNLYKSDYVWDLTGNPSVSGYADIGSFSSSKSGAFTSFGYGSSQNHIRIDDASGYVKCEWVRDYLPDHLDSNSDSLCIEMWCYNRARQAGNYPRLVTASGWYVDAPAGFELNGVTSSSTSFEIWHSWGQGGSNRAGVGSQSITQDAWSHFSWLWDFQNSRAAFHLNGTQVYTSTNSNVAVGSTWDLDAATAYTHNDHAAGKSELMSALTLGDNRSGGSFSTNFQYDCGFMECIVSVDDSTKQSRYGSSFTPSTTALI
jgi:hypothetical protein